MDGSYNSNTQIASKTVADTPVSFEFTHTDGQIVGFVFACLSATAGVPAIFDDLSLVEVVE
ncbi:MAG: hypothetical protein J6Q54_08680 [Oscillospiraceae bacterium]|nr:hypothetical protein [Oscillospiraceae bacterium]